MQKVKHQKLAEKAARENAAMNRMRIEKVNEK